MFQYMEKSRTATMAIQNPGMETQNREKNENKLSIKELARVAEMTPMGTEMSRVTTMAKKIISKVAGRRSAMRSETFSFLCKERPKFPWTALPSQLKYRR